MPMTGLFFGFSIKPETRPEILELLQTTKSERHQETAVTGQYMSMSSVQMSADLPCTIKSLESNRTYSKIF